MLPNERAEILLSRVRVDRVLEVLLNAVFVPLGKKTYFFFQISILNRNSELGKVELVIVYFALSRCEWLHFWQHL